MKPIASTKRRWVTLLILTIAWAQVTWGCLVLRDSLGRPGSVIYWAICLVLTLTAAILAMVEFGASWLTWRREREQCRRRHDQWLR